jgi:hypothetical protein
VGAPGQQVAHLGAEPPPRAFGVLAVDAVGAPNPHGDARRLGRLNQLPGQRGLGATGRVRFARGQACGRAVGLAPERDVAGWPRLLLSCWAANTRPRPRLRSPVSSTRSTPFGCGARSGGPATGPGDDD